jgi:hypothetical protein
MVFWVMTPCSGVVKGAIHFTLKMEMAWFSETFISYITTWCYNPQDHELNIHHHNNFKSCKKHFD